MRSRDIDRVLALCGKHLQVAKSPNSEVESLLAIAIPVRMHAELELFVKNEFEEAALSMGWSRERARDLFRGMLSGQLPDGLSLLGGDRKTSFDARASGQQRTVSFCSNVIGNRHHVARGPGARVTVQEVGSFCKEGHTALDWFREALSPSCA